MKATGKANDVELKALIEEVFQRISDGGYNQIFGHLTDPLEDEF